MDSVLRFVNFCVKVNWQAQNCPVWSFSIQDTRVNTFPYSQDFETASDWLPIGSESSWVLGTPAKSKINAAASGVKSYVTGGLGSTSYNSNENSYLISPLFDFTTQVSYLCTL